MTTYDDAAFHERMRRRQADGRDLMTRSTEAHDELQRAAVFTRARGDFELSASLVNAADCIHELQPLAQNNEGLRAAVATFTRDWMLASSLLQEAWRELGLPSHLDATRAEMLAKIRELRRAAGAVPVPELTSLLEVARDAGATDPTLDVGPDGLRLTIGPDDNAARIGTVMLAHTPAMRPFIGTHTAGLFKYDRRPCPRCAEMDGWGCERHQRVT